MADIKFGIVGTGWMAKTIITAFEETPGAQAVAVVSKDSYRATDFATSNSLSHSYTSIDEMLGAGKIDAVYIANDTRHHAADTLKVLEAGMPVIVEKPFATTAEEAEAIITAAEKNKTFCMEAMWLRFIPSVRLAEGLVQDGAIGSVRQFTADFGYARNAATAPRLFGDASDAGVLLDHGVYPLSMALHFMGPVAKTYSFVERASNGTDIQSTILLEHEGGGQSRLGMSMTAMLPNMATISGTHGRIDFKEPLLGCEALVLHQADPMDAPKVPSPSRGRKDKIVSDLKKSSVARRIKRQFFPDGKTIHIPYGPNRYTWQLAEAITCIKAGKLKSATSSLHDSAKVLAILAEIKKSG